MSALASHIAVAAATAGAALWAAGAREPKPATPAAKEARPAEIAKAKESPDDLIEMEVRDIMTLQNGTANAVILTPKGGDTIVPIFIGDAEATAIALRLRRESPPRPLTHDLMEKIIRSLGARVTKIHIDDLRNEVYLGRVFLAHGDQAIEMDARPSDSIALAIGSHAPIFAARKVIDHAGLTRKDLEKSQDRPNPKHLLKAPGGARDDSL